MVTLDKIRLTGQLPRSPRKGASSFREPLLEPVVRVGLVVERRDLSVALSAIERDRFGERAVGLELHRSRAVLTCEILELAEQPSPEPDAAKLARDPHALQVRRCARF